MAPLTDRKKHRIAKAVRLHYGDGLTHREIADEMDVTRRTVTGYLNTDYAESRKRPYSDKEEYELRKALEEKQRDVEELTDRVVREVVESPESDPGDMLRAVRELRDTTESLVGFFDDLGILRATPDRHEVRHGGGVDVLGRLREARDELEDGG